MTTEKFQYANPRDLIADSNIRQSFDEQGIVGLMASLEEVKMLQPIRVRQVETRLLILDGARRCMAAIRLNWEKVPILIDNAILSDAETIHRQFIANCQHEHLTVSEQALAIMRLMELTMWSSSEVAKRLCISMASVTKSLAILTLPKDILEKVDQGTIPASSAYELTKVKDTSSQAELANQVTAGKLTRDGLIGAIRKRNSKDAPKPKNPSSGRAVASLDADRTVTVCGPGLDMASFIAWLEELLSKARRERTRGVELATFVNVLRDQSRITG